MAAAILSPTGLTLAQVTFDVATTPGASVFIDRLLADFSEIDPALVVVFSNGIDDEDLLTALTTGRVDVAFTAEPSSKLRAELEGMAIERVATISEQLADALTFGRMAAPIDIYAIHPASPSPEVTHFLRFIASRTAVSTLQENRVDAPSDSTDLNAALQTPTFRSP